MLKKTTLVLAICLMGISNLFSQTFLSGKYRAMFYDLPTGNCDHLCRIKAEKDSFTYCISGFREGDQFEAAIYCNKKVIALQRFYMNGMLDNNEICVGDLFNGNYTIDSFLKDYFNYSIESSPCNAAKKKKSKKARNIAKAPEGAFLLEKLTSCAMVCP